MKKNLQKLFLAVSIVFCAGVAKSQTLLHYWDFNQVTGSIPYDSLSVQGIVPIPSTFSLVGSGKFFYIPLPGVSINDSLYWDYEPAVGGTLNIQMSDSAGSCMRMRNPSDSMQGLFYIPSTGYNNIVVSFETESSNSGPTSQNYSYSLDSGANWLTSGISPTTFAVTTVFQLVSVAFDATANNKAGLIFRVQQGTPNHALAHGNDRYDNFAVNGTAIGSSSVPSISSSQLDAALFPNPASGTINIASSAGGLKVYTVFDAIGKQIASYSFNGTQTTLDISQLNVGLYFINLQSDGKHSILKFIKN